MCWGCDVKGKAAYTELVGMILALGSVGWQFFIERPLAANESSAREYRIGRKLDAVWLVLTDMFTHEFPDRAGMTSTTNLVELSRHLDAAGKNDDRIEWQAKMATLITRFAFLFGSSLIVVAKWMVIGVDEQARKASV
jgi:hypothetical protein